MSNVMSMRFVPAALAAVVLAVAAGCGQSGAVGSAASAVPGSAVVYVTADTSFEGGQWRAVSDLLAKFPDGEGLLEDLLEEATAEAGLEGDADLRAALGPEVALVVLDVPSAADAEPSVVVLTKPEDEDAFDRLLEGAEAVRGEVQGWQVVAPTEADLERYREELEASTLEGSEDFEQAMDDLPDEALARVYVNGEALAETAAALPPGMMQPPPLGLAGGPTGSIGAALVAESDGVRFEGHAIASGDADLPQYEAFESELVEEVPAGAVAFLAFNDLGSALSEYLGMVGAAGAAGQLPFDPAQIAELLSGEVALYVRPGPAVTLVAEVEDEAAALQTVESLVGLAGGEAPIVYEAFDGLLAVSNSQAELDALRGDGPRLDQDDRFEEALDRAGMPDATVGFGYVDVQAAVPLLTGLMAPLGDDGDLPAEYLEPLGGLVFWGESSGEAQRFSLYLGIE
jgi:hypothetical protein